MKIEWHLKVNKERILRIHNEGVSEIRKKSPVKAVIDQRFSPEEVSNICPSVTFWAKGSNVSGSKTALWMVFALEVSHAWENKLTQDASHSKTNLFKINLFEYHKLVQFH